MSAKSDYLENKVLDHVLGKGARNFTSPPALYLALHTADPGETGAGAEVAGGSYAREVITFGAATGGSCSNSAQVTFNNLPGSITVSHVAVRDALSSGNLLYYGPLTASRTIDSGGGSLVFPVAAVVISEG